MYKPPSHGGAGSPGGPGGRGGRGGGRKVVKPSKTQTARDKEMMERGHKKGLKEGVEKGRLEGQREGGKEGYNKGFSEGKKHIDSTVRESAKKEGFSKGIAKGQKATDLVIRRAATKVFEEKSIRPEQTRQAHLEGYAKGYKRGVTKFKKFGAGTGPRNKVDSYVDMGIGAIGGAGVVLAAQETVGKKKKTKTKTARTEYVTKRKSWE